MPSGSIRASSTFPEPGQAQTGVPSACSAVTHWLPSGWPRSTSVRPGSRRAGSSTRISTWGQGVGAGPMGTSTATVPGSPPSHVSTTSTWRTLSGGP
ncbi:MAG: hypothetical protein R3F59_06765 [Myxococcota bacterium]